MLLSELPQSLRDSPLKAGARSGGVELEALGLIGQLLFAVLQP